MPKLIVYLLALALGCGQPAQKVLLEIIPGAHDLDSYLSLLKDKSVGLCVNHSSTIGKRHLTDSLNRLGVRIKRVFTPEHGFSGTTSDGVMITYEDQKAGFELISLYGKNKKPTPDQLKGIDIMVFDMQDVGTRFYTYISTLHYVMEACAEQEVPLILLDRPNPNGSYVDGPVLDTVFRSFVGMHPIPVVHGLTVGELAQMINGEGWLTGGLQCDLSVVPVQNWEHAMPYSLPIKPSPNLPNDLSIALYPSLCLFEGTILSVGRGTDYAFQQVGHPLYPDTAYSFTPVSREGAKWPPFENETCYGVNWIGEPPSYRFSLAPLMESYQKMKEETFFNDYFRRLAGTDLLQKQIEQGMSEAAIREPWEADLEAYRKKSLDELIYN